MANKMNSAILITYDKEDAVTEAIGLCHAAGIQVLHTIKQGFLKKPKYGISGGVLEKLEEIAEKLKPDVIVFDEILKPSQYYNLASVLHREILVREALILEIFESRASSAESKLQVKLAQLRYEMVRAKERVRLSSMGEQPGFMGIGKFEIDVYHDDIKHRMQSIKSKLEKAGKQRELHRQGRKRLGFKTISLRCEGRGPVRPHLCPGQGHHAHPERQSPRNDRRGGLRRCLFYDLARGKAH